MQTGEPEAQCSAFTGSGFVSGEWRVLRDLAVEVEVGWSIAGDQPCTATECQILYCPLNENENATLERNQIGYMDKSPNQPR
jgi:hypothetical protein